jgi:hypothetical protein
VAPRIQSAHRAIVRVVLEQQFRIVARVDADFDREAVGEGDLGFADDPAPEAGPY